MANMECDGGVGHALRPRGLLCDSRATKREAEKQDDRVAEGDTEETHLCSLA
jgi:hypothetical protein